MHLQIRTSPDTTAGNIRTVLRVLARVEINIEGIGPDFEPPHVRLLVSHEAFDKALRVLEDADLNPETRPAVTLALPNSPGQLSGRLEELILKGYTPESVLVLAGRDNEGRTLVSVGVRETVPPDWAERVIALGGLG